MKKKGNAISSYIKKKKILFYKFGKITYDTKRNQKFTYFLSIRLFWKNIPSGT